MQKKESCFLSNGSFWQLEVIYAEIYKRHESYLISTSSAYQRYCKIKENASEYRFQN